MRSTSITEPHTKVAILNSRVRGDTSTVVIGTDHINAGTLPKEESLLQ
jgi:hypothetical protein